MPNSLFIQRLRITTSDGQVAYDERFHRGVNIIRGENSSGKSTIVRFIFFVLGGCYGDFVHEALQCRDVMAEICINSREVITVSRFLEKRPDGKVNGFAPMYFFYGTIEEALSVHGSWQKFGYKTTSEQRSFSNVLFEMMGLPEFRADSNITMHQILRLIYLDQESPLSSLFFFEQFDKEIVRETVSQLLMGLYNQDLSEAKQYQQDLQKRIDDISLAIRYTGETLADPRAKSTEYIQSIIEKLTREIENNTILVTNLREKQSNTSARLKRDYDRLQKDIANMRRTCSNLENDIERLEVEQQDTQYFIEALQYKIDAINRSAATRDYFDSLHLEYCPECLTKIADTANDGYCRLCKSPIDNSKGKSQALRIKLELEFQIKESRTLMKDNQNVLLEKKALLNAKRQQLAATQKKYDHAVGNVRSTKDEKIDQLIQEIGFKEGEIIQYRTMLEQAERYESLLKELDKLKGENASLCRYLDAEENRIEKEERVINRSISENGVYLLKNDHQRQSEFINASDFKVSYKQNLAYISNQRIKLSASSEFYLKMAARFALFFASLQVDTMMYPRLMFSDNMEDKGMEPFRAGNFQRLVVERLKQMPNQDYQLIFATSMIAPELDIPEYTIGERYTHENKSLKFV